MEELLKAFGPFWMALQPVLVAHFNNFLIQKAKHIQSIPISSGQTAKLRIVLTVLTLAGNGLGAYLSGNLADPSFIDGVSVAVQSLIGFAWSHYSYQLFIKPKETVDN